MSLASTFDVANGHFFCMGGYQGQNSVFSFCCAVLLFCCFVMMFCHSLLSDFIVVLFWRNVQLHRREFGYSRLIKESRSRKKSIAIFAFKTLFNVHLHRCFKKVIVLPRWKPVIRYLQASSRGRVVNTA